MHTAKYLILVLFLLMALPGITAQQKVPLPEIAPPSQAQGSEEPDNVPSVPPDIQKSMEKKANQERQAELKKDADQLLKLSTELKAYVDKTNENILSVDVIKKADEIEKLAHNVKVKMRGNE